MHLPIFLISHSNCFATELLRSESLTGDLVLKHLWHHPDAILCCSLKVSPRSYGTKPIFCMYEKILTYDVHILFGFADGACIHLRKPGWP